MVPTFLQLLPRLRETSSLGQVSGDGRREIKVHTPFRPSTPHQGMPAGARTQEAVISFSDRKTQQCKQKIARIERLSSAELPDVNWCSFVTEPLGGDVVLAKSSSPDFAQLREIMGRLEGGLRSGRIGGLKETLFGVLMGDDVLLFCCHYVYWLFLVFFVRFSLFLLLCCFVLWWILVLFQWFWGLLYDLCVCVCLCSFMLC